MTPSLRPSLLSLSLPQPKPGLEFLSWKSPAEVSLFPSSPFLSLSLFLPSCQCKQGERGREGKREWRGSFTSSLRSKVLCSRFATQRGIKRRVSS